MANGNISDDKVVRMAVWFAVCCEGDLDSDAANDYLNGDSDRPTAGASSLVVMGWREYLNQTR